MKTKRLVLREVTAKDALWYFKHFNIWEIVDGQESPGPRDMKAARRELKHYFTDNFKNGTGIRWGITLKGSNDLVGSTGFYKWNKKTSQVETGYDLDPEYSGQGTMTEAMTAIIQYAFDVMKVNRIEALVSPRNKNSLRLLRGLGFRKEGTLREHDFYDGKFVDDFLFSLLKRDWQQGHR
ncbi:MAG: GNAT family N-acetyltransferase [Candidatus Thermoplasmatota archaeon]|nr:GNAT family N-acetyltransferase [Candidatus Thermoplasmatota archaeon]